MTNASNSYADQFANWQPKLLGGARPGNDLLSVIHALGARPGKQALANAMAMRPNGVTGGEIVVACGAPQLNKMRGFIQAGLVARDMNAAPRNGHTVYKLTLTAKGAAVVRAADAAVAKLAVAGEAPKAKVTKVVKPRKPRAVKPVVQPVMVTASAGGITGTPVPVNTGDQPVAPQG